ncbi:helix-turn-helix domain-containing protein [Tardisphaera miroshnichenkoae]
MPKALKVRLYPADNQEVLLEKHCGAWRFVRKHPLELSRKARTTEEGPISALRMPVMTSFTRRL